MVKCSSKNRTFQNKPLNGLKLNFQEREEIVMKKIIEQIKKIAESLIKKFAPKVKEEAKEFAAEALEKLKDKVENFDYSDELEAVIDFVMDRIKLPLWLKPFKGVVRNVITETVEALIEELKDRIEEIGE